MASLGNNLAAAVAFNRFGLGGRPDDAIPGSPSQWLVNQLTGPDPCSNAGLPGTTANLAMMAAFQAATTPAAQANARLAISKSLSAEIAAYLLNALTTRLPFRERLVQFWANHFALMADHSGVNCCAGAYVREAIRPNVTGSFKTMLAAVMQHPAMLYNLNAPGSTGPQSQTGLGCQATGCTNVGINENLGRECLELHTVGVNAGYTQADVDAMAMLLTGWTVQLQTAPRGFYFNPRCHQPGNQVLMGQTFGPGQQGCLDALAFLGTDPATYQHLATKLVTHFVSDTPAASDVATVAAALSNSGGNLAAASSALVGLANAWVPNQKLRTPTDYALAVLRATGATTNGDSTANNLAATVLALGAPVWQPPFPNGYSDLASDWGSPAQMMLRADWINALATLLPALDPNAVAASALGPLLTPATTTAVNAATAQHDKLALLFLSPEFQRR